jgi:hypothetical protein
MQITNLQKSLLCFAAAPLSFLLLWLTKNGLVMILFLIGSVLGVLYLNAYFAERALRKPVKSAIDIDDLGVTRHLDKGKTEQIRWDQLEKIEIITTSDGPWGEDVFWVFHEDDKGCVVPNSDPRVGELIQKIESFEAYDANAVIAAMGSASEATFLVWQRKKDGV